MRPRICLFILSLLFAAQSVAQSAMERKVTLHFSGVSVSKLLSELERQAGVSFMYEDRVIDVTAKVSIHVDSRSLHQVLRIIFPDETIAFSCVDNQIIIHRTKVVARQTIPPNTRVRYLPVYDTIRVTVFDTLVTTLADTSVVLVYDTLFTDVPILESIEWVVFPAIDLRREYYGRSPDSLAKLRMESEAALPGFSLFAGAYQTFGGVQLGAGIMYRQMHTRLSYNIQRNVHLEVVDTAYYTRNYYEYFLSGDWMVTSYGDSVYVRGVDSIAQSELVAQTVTRSRSYTQTYTSHGTAVSGFIGLPISVRKSFSINSRSAIVAEATSELSIRLFSQVPSEYGELAPDFGMRSVFWYGSIGAAYEHTLGNGSKILCMSRFSVSAQQLYNSGAGTNVRTISSFGIGYAFGK